MRYAVRAWTLGVLLAVGCSREAAPVAPAAPKEEPKAAAAPTPSPVAKPAKPASVQADGLGERKLTPEQKAFAEAVKKATTRRPTPERAPAETVLTAGMPPEELVVAVGKAIDQKKLQVIWEMLPAKYQAELKGIVDDFVAKVDPALWNSLTSSVQLAAFGLRQQKTRFFAHPVAEMLPIDKATLEKIWDPAVEVADALVLSELYDVEEFKKMDMPQFFANTGPVLLEHLQPIAQAFAIAQVDEITSILSSLKDVKASKVSGDDTTAVVKIEFPDRDPADVEFIKVEDKWIPKDLESQWAGWMQQVKDLLGQLLADDTEEGKKKLEKLKGTQLLAQLGIAFLARTETDDQFHDSVKAAWKILMKEDFPDPRKKGEPAKEGSAPSADATPAEDSKPAETSPAP